jgi:3-hydroxybutyryl-CoA dehydrogenase
MKLVEVAATDRTDEACVQRAIAFIESIDRVPVVVKDAPGFIVNQLALASCNQAVRLLEEGVAGVEDIDRAMRIGVAHPLGPLELGDTIGWDIVLAALENMAQATGDGEYRPRPLLRRLVASGRLGRKSGRGLYLYDAPGGTRLRAAPDVGL